MKRLLGGSDIKENCQIESWFDLKFRCVVRRMVMQRAGQTSSSRITNGDSSSNLEFGAINPSGVIPNCRFESGPHSQLLFLWAYSSLLVERLICIQEARRSQLLRSKISKENTCGMQEIHAYGDLAKNDNIRQKPSRC